MDFEEELTEISGRVESVVYTNEENGYSVVRILTDSGEAVVTGCLPFVMPGEYLVSTGKWNNNSNYGIQFQAEFTQRLLPRTEESIYCYLASGAIKGIGPAIASQIVCSFGERTFDVIENHPEKLGTIRGISKAKALQFSERFRNQLGVRRLLEYSGEYALRPVLALRLYKHYGNDALSMLQANPYLLAAPQIGGSFYDADRLAQEIGMEDDNANRLQAALIYELRHNLNNGHCFIPFDKLIAATSSLISIEKSLLEEILTELIVSGRIVNEEIAHVNACYLPEIYEAEVYTAERVRSMLNRRFDDVSDIDAIIEKTETALQLSFAEMQIKTLAFALERQILVITGGPGTGKTTSIKALLAMFDSLGMKTLLTAPTGRAAKRMSEVTGNDASTIHRLLEARFDDIGERVVFSKCETDLLDCDALILDECSMVDILLMSALLKALPAYCRLILVGDADQLPSVGPGNVFSAFIRSNVLPVVRLNQIFRQDEGSRIVYNAHLINDGRYPDFSENKGDFYRLRRSIRADACDTVVDLISSRLPQKMNIPVSNIQVLSPTKKGELGTVHLNERLQEVLNPASGDKNEKSFGNKIFRVGDRVMQIRNNYDVIWTDEHTGECGIGIFNGDIGTISAISLTEESLCINFDGKLALYAFDSLSELDHAWAVTVHKAQGSEYDAVVFVLSDTSKMLLTRDVLYTGITRAKSLLILVGEDNTAYQMIDNYKRSNRYSALRTRLIQQ